MSNRYLGDHIAGDHIHTDITTGNIEEPQQKFCQGTVSIDYWEGGGFKQVCCILFPFCPLY